MLVTMNTVVTMTYELKDTDGNVLESSTEPVAYLHGGYDNIFPKVEEAIHGKNVGDVVIVDLQPDDAFGEYDEELVQIEPASAFPAADLKVGMQLIFQHERNHLTNGSLILLIYFFIHLGDFLHLGFV